MFPQVAGQFARDLLRGPLQPLAEASQLGDAYLEHENPSMEECASGVVHVERSSDSSKVLRRQHLVFPYPSIDRVVGRGENRAGLREWDTGIEEVEVRLGDWLRLGHLDKRSRVRKARRVVEFV